MSSRQCVTPDSLCCSHPTVLTLCEWEEGEVGEEESGRRGKWEEGEVGGGSGRRRSGGRGKWEVEDC